MSIVQDYLKGLTRGIEELARQDLEKIADIIFTARQKGNRVFIMGNGGSAATASHFANDLQIGARAGGKAGVPALSLTDNTAIITALANDIGYDSVFVEQLAGCLAEGDVVIGISASGNSPNVLKAIEYARQNGGITIGFVGFGGGKLKALASKSIVLSSKDYGQVEGIHDCLAHLVTSLVREKIAHA